MSRLLKLRRNYPPIYETIKQELGTIKELLSRPGTTYPATSVWINGRMPSEEVESIISQLPYNGPDPRFKFKKISRSAFRSLLCKNGEFHSLAMKNPWAQEYLAMVSRLLPLIRKANGETILTDWKWWVSENKARHGPTLRHKDPYWQQYHPSLPASIPVDVSDRMAEVPVARVGEEVRSLVSALPALSGVDVVAVRDQMEKPRGERGSWDTGTRCKFEFGKATYAEAVDEIVWEIATHRGRPPRYSAKPLPEEGVTAAFVEVDLPSGNTLEFSSYTLRVCRRAPNAYAVFRAESPPF